MTFGARFGLLVKRYREGEGISATELALTALGDGAKRSRISELENGKVANPHAKTIKALCETLGISDEEVDACRQLPQEQDDRQTAETVRDDYGSLTGALDALRDLSRSQLEMLARRFDIEDAAKAKDSELTALLEKKAEEYRAYKNQIDAIDDRMASLGNMKAAAQEAAERLDFAEVENLLSIVLATELDIAWQTASLRADNALLRGRVDDAYTILSAAADAFAAVDPVEPARRRINDHRLYNHALRYGGSGFTRTIDLKRSALDRLSEQEQPKLFGAARNDLGNALQNQGSRIGGDGGARLLGEAVEAYRAALRVYTEADYPVDWAMTQNNLAIALGNQGERTTGEDAARLLGEAVDAFRAALRVRTEADHPAGWAMTQNNLAVALRNQGSRTGGEVGARLLGEAVEAFRAALRIYTEADHPVDWAMTKNNLAIALATQGSRTGGQDGARLLGEAVEAFRAALRVRNQVDHPVQWAETQENMALAEEALAEHDTCTDPRPQLEAALVHLDNALRVFDPVHMAFNHEKATDARARIAGKLANFGDG